MADNYVTISSYPTVQVTGPQTVVDVLRIGFRTIPSGVVAFANAPGKKRPGQSGAALAAQLAATYIGPLALGIERAMGLGFIADASHEEDVSASGLLVDRIAFVVEYVPTDTALRGEFQAEVIIPIFSFDEPSFFNALVLDPLNQTYAELQAIAGL